MTKQHPPYTAILPTILCQQPAVILHWLRTERATGNLPVEIALDCIVELLSRQTMPSQPSEYGKVFVDSLLGELGTVNYQLEVYKRAVKAATVYIDEQFGGLSSQVDCDCSTCNLVHALAAVDQLEGK